MNPCYPLLQCTAGHPHCFPMHGLCVYSHDQYGHLEYCRNGAHLSDCQMFSCSGYFKRPSSYCVSVWKLCDNITDCPNGEDENDCLFGQELLCPGFLRCKGVGCVHPLQVCDGLIDCPVGQEDEYGCDNAACPGQCDCLGATMSCYEDISIDVRNYKAFFRVNVNAKFIQLSNGESLYMLNLSKNALAEITATTFLGQPNLRMLDLSSNRIHKIRKLSFAAHVHLIHIGFEGNQIKTVEMMAFTGLLSLDILDLSKQNISNLYGLFAAMPLSVKLLNVSRNSIEWLNIPEFDKHSNLATIDIRYNHVIRLNTSASNLHFNLSILTDISYLCCFIGRYTCRDKPRLSTCPLQQTMYSTICLGIFTAIVNVIQYVSKRGSYEDRFAALLFLLHFTSSMMLGASILIPLLKDHLYPPNAVHSPQGGKYVYCLLSGTFQFSLLLLRSWLGFLKHANIYWGITSFVKKGSRLYHRKCVYLVMSSIIQIFLSSVPILITLRSGLFPKCTRVCSIFNDLNNGGPEAASSIGVILCFVIIYCISHVAVSSKIFITVQVSQTAVTQMGGKISMGKGNKIKLFLKCIIQPIISALLQTVSIVVCLMALNGWRSEHMDMLLGWVILLPSTMQPAL